MTLLRYLKEKSTYIYLAHRLCKWDHGKRFDHFMSDDWCITVVLELSMLPSKEPHRWGDYSHYRHV